MYRPTRAISFNEAAESLYVMVKRGAEFVILSVKRVITRFLNGKMMRTIILSDGSHYADDERFIMWEAAV